MAISALGNVTNPLSSPGRIQSRTSINPTRTRTPESGSRSSNRGTSIQRRIMDELRRQGQDPWINPATGNIATFPRPGTPGGGQTDQQSSQALTDALFQQRKEAEQKAEAEYKQAKEAIDAAYTAGLMTDTEYQDALNESFETTRAQFGNVARELTEGTYGRINRGAVEGRLASLKGQEAEAIGRGERGVRESRAERRATAAETKAQGYQDLFRTRQIPRIGIPEGLSREELTRTITGPTATPTPTPTPTRRPRTDLITGGIRRAF